MKRTIEYHRAALISTKQFENTRIELKDSIELDLTRWGDGDDERDLLIRKVDAIVARKILEAKGLLKDPQQESLYVERAKIRRRDQARAVLREAGFASTVVDDDFLERLIQS